MLGVKNVFAFSDLLSLSQNKEVIMKHLAEVFQKGVLNQTCESWATLGFSYSPSFHLAPSEVSNLN